MIARNVTMRLKANSVAEFTQTLEKEIIPLLRTERLPGRNHVHRSRRQGNGWN